MIYEWSAQIKFHPWVGSKYNDSPRKVLLLGDSHYGEGEPYKECTQDVIQEWCINRTKPHRFFTGIIWTLFGNTEDLEKKFGKIAFYNYVQKFMPAPRISPSKIDYEAAQKPFIEVLEKLSPNFVVTFGYAMTWHFPCTAEENNWKKDVVNDNHDVWVSEFKIGSLNIPVYSLPHPSGRKFNMRIYFQYFSNMGLSIQNLMEE